MKKVCGSLTAIFWAACLLFFPVCVWIETGWQGTIEFNVFVVCVFSVLVAAVFFSFVSYWAYGESGIELLNWKGKTLKKYYWNEFLSITYENLPGPSFYGWATLELKDGKKIPISRLSTRNYFKVLTDVVRYTDKYSPETYTSP